MQMPMYMAMAKWTPAAVAAAAKEGFVSRHAATSRAWESVGGKLLAQYHGNVAGEWDVINIVEVPDRDSAFAVAAAAMGSGAVARSAIMELFTPEEADAALKHRSADYRPPGQS
jgi:uncharacterized protein with GYD domain